MQLASSDLYRAHWTSDIHDEWIRNLLKNRDDLTIVQLTRTRELMDAGVPDCLVKDYHNLIPTLELPDPDDRHVLAAAIVAKAQVLCFVTSRNRQHQPRRHHNQINNP